MPHIRSHNDQNKKPMTNPLTRPKRIKKMKILLKKMSLRRRIMLLMMKYPILQISCIKDNTRRCNMKVMKRKDNTLKPKNTAIAFKYSPKPKAKEINQEKKPKSIFIPSIQVPIKEQKLTSKVPWHLDTINDDHMPAHEYDIYYSDNTQAPTTTGTIRSTTTISKPNLALDSGEVQDLRTKEENQKSSETEKPTQDLEDKEDDNSNPSINFENIFLETVSKSQTIPNLTPISKELEIQEILDYKWELIL